MTSTLVRVRSMTREAENVLALELADPNGGPLPPWEPGAHIDLLLPNGMERQYSLCGQPQQRSWTVAVLHEPAGRGGSRFVHTELRPGVLLGIRGPRNHFPLTKAAAYLFIAGGIGITPLMPMIAVIRRRGVPWQLLYGGRRRASMAFLDELSAIERDDPGHVTIQPEDEAGLLDLEAAVTALDDGGAVYACGPEPMLSAVESVCRDRNVPIHVERFAARPRQLFGADGSFEVECRRSATTVQVGPQESIVTALERAGLRPDHSCLDGVCGTCETAVLDGVPDHRDSILTPDEHTAGDTMMICVSRSLSPRLVLDL